MTRLYQENGHSLLAEGQGLDTRATPAARPRSKDWQPAPESELDPSHTPGLLVGPKGVSYQSLLRTNTITVSRVWVFFRLLRLLFFGTCSGPVSSGVARDMRTLKNARRLTPNGSANCWCARRGHG